MGFFFLPGGLGAQDASYYGLLALYGVPNPEVAAAFVILKRSKELFWIALGYLLLLWLPARVREVTGQRHVGEDAPEGATGAASDSSDRKETS